jgi:HAD superfamily hydrolase (TIGR01509 family)
MQWFSTEKLQLMPFVVEAIEYFNQLQLRPAVCSGAPKDEILLKLRRSSLSKYFNPDKVASRDNVKRGKPFPDIYLHAASLIGLEPEQCMAFEDTQYGVQSAKDAGLYCVAIPTKWSRFQDFSRADIVLKDFRETIKYCSRLLYDTL